MPTRTPEGTAADTLAPVRREFLLVVLAALCWGTSGISGAGRRPAHRPGRRGDIAWHGLAVGAAVLLAVHLLTRGRRAPDVPPTTRGTTVRLILCRVAMDGYQLAYFAAVARAEVSVATIVALGTAPLLIVVGAALLGSGRPDQATVLALVVPLTGLVLLVGVSAGTEI